MRICTCICLYVLVFVFVYCANVFAFLFLFCALHFKSVFQVEFRYILRFIYFCDLLNIYIVFVKQIWMCICICIYISIELLLYNGSTRMIIFYIYFRKINMLEFYHLYTIIVFQVLFGWKENNNYYTKWWICTIWCDILLHVFHNSISLLECFRF